MTSFYARHTPTSLKKKMAHDLQQHISTHLHRAMTTADLEKAYTQCKRRVLYLRDKRSADNLIREHDEELQASRGARRMTRQEQTTWLDIHNDLIASSDSLRKEELDEADSTSGGGEGEHRGMSR